MHPEIVGSLVLAVPALIVAWLALWRRTKPVFWFAAVLILVGVGYLNTTGATRDIGARFVPAGTAVSPAGH